MTTDQAAFWQRRRANDDLEAIARRSVCAVCGAGLRTPLVDGEIIPRCSQDPAHRGMATPLTPYQAYARGEALPQHVVNAIESKLRRSGKGDKQRAPEPFEPRNDPPMTPEQREKAEREMKELFE